MDKSIRCPVDDQLVTTTQFSGCCSASCEKSYQFLMLEKRRLIYQAIIRECNYQYKKWSRPNLTVGEFLLITENELNEAKQAYVKNIGNEEALKELLQVIAVGFSCLEQHEIIERSEDE